ncbi:MAG: hypothetical protein H0W75_07160 [Chitinophagaceae bacterium]|nr:hypothetical protein [Chitinophagaceae bacterium]
MPQKNRNKYWLFILLIILLSAVGYYLFTKNKKLDPKNFTQQGQSELNAGKIGMKVWDYSAEDGDSIQVYFDGKLIADSLALLYEPVEYKLGNLSAGEHWIGVKAINQGWMGAASPHVRISNGRDSFDIDIEAWKDSVPSSWKVIIK